MLNFPETIARVKQHDIEVSIERRAREYRQTRRDTSVQRSNRVPRRNAR